MLRSMLFVPADSERKLAKAEGAAADALILDLEDSVLPERKALARSLASQYLRHPPGATPAWVRVNDLLSGEILKDLAAVMPARPAGIVLPKIRGPEDVQTVAHYLDALEESSGAAGTTPIPILALVTENPRGAAAHGRARPSGAGQIGRAELGRGGLGARPWARESRVSPNGEWRPMYQYARDQCILAAHALGLEALDTVYVNFRDAAGLTAACQASRHDGFTGRFAIHPDQVAVINEAFTPSESQRVFARRLIDAFASGAGVVSLDGKMYDVPPPEGGAKTAQARITSNSFRRSRAMHRRRVPRAGVPAMRPCHPPNDGTTLRRFRRALNRADQPGDEVAHRHASQRRRVREHQNGLGLLGPEMRRDAGLELLHQHRHPLGAAPAVTDGVVHRHARARRPVLEEHLHGIADVALVRRVVVLRELRVLPDLHLGTNLIDARNRTQSHPRNPTPSVGRTAAEWPPCTGCSDPGRPGWRAAPSCR